MVAPCAPAQHAYLAVGVISAPDYVQRRGVLRGTWMTLLASESAAESVCASFVVRARGAPPRVERLLGAEERSYGDILRVDVPWNETRLRGPVLTLAAWVRHASAHLPRARFVAKVDDDSYLHAPGLAQLLRHAVDDARPHAMTYAGTLTWYSWFPKQWDRCGFGWSWQGSMGMGQFCRNASWAAARCAGGCGAADGPFPFAAGYLIVLSNTLVTAIAASPGLAAEEARLAASGALHTHKGYRHTQIFEDVWLGSFVHRFLTPGTRHRPIEPRDRSDSSRPESGPSIQVGPSHALAAHTRPALDPPRAQARR